MSWDPKRPPFGPLRVPVGVDIIGMFQRLADRGVIRQDQVPREEENPCKRVEHEGVKVEPLPKPKRSASLYLDYEWTTPMEDETVVQVLGEEED